MFNSLQIHYAYLSLYHLFIVKMISECNMAFLMNQIFSILTDGRQPWACYYHQEIWFYVYIIVFENNFFSETHL